MVVALLVYQDLDRADKVADALSFKAPDCVPVPLALLQFRLAPWLLWTLPIDVAFVLPPGNSYRELGMVDVIKLEIESLERGLFDVEWVAPRQHPTRWQRLRRRDRQDVTPEDV